MNLEQHDGQLKLNIEKTKVSFDILTKVKTFVQISLMKGKFILFLYERPS